jgi:hypothetical protein
VLLTFGAPNLHHSGSSGRAQGRRFPARRSIACRASFDPNHATIYRRRQRRTAEISISDLTPIDSAELLRNDVRKNQRALLSRRSLKLIERVCGLAGSLTFLDDVRVGLQKAGIQNAVAKYDTPRIFDWLLESFSYQGVSDQVARNYIRQHGSASQRACGLLRPALFCKAIGISTAAATTRTALPVPNPNALSGAGCRGIVCGTDGSIKLPTASTCLSEISPAAILSTGSTDVWVWDPRIQDCLAQA